MRWVLVVLVVLVLLGVWVGAYFVPDLRWFAEALTAAAVGIPVLVVLALWVRDRLRRSRATEPRAAPQPTRRPEVTLLRKHLRAAVKELRRVRGGAAAARRLPWYVVLSAPGAGASDILDRLGLTLLQPPRAAAEGEPPCALWCSGDAVVVEWPAPARPGEGDEREHWLALLTELRRLRGEQALDGVLVMLGVADLQSAVDADLHDQATRVRARLDEALERLGLVLPAYLVVTRADLLPGFTEFWANDPKADDSTWGASFGLADDTALHEPGRAVRRELDGLAQALHVRLLDRLPEEADPSRRVRVLRFPVEFRAVDAPLERFVEGLCRPGPLPERFVFRGFYLVSAGEPRTKGRFVTDLLRSVVLPDRHLAMPTAAAARKRARRDVVFSSAAVGALVLALLPALVSYAHNMRLAQDAEASATTLNAAGTESTPGMRGDPIEPALETLRQMETDARSFGIPGWFGPRAARELPDELTDAYVARLHAWLVHRLRASLEKRLDDLVWGAPLTDAPSTPDDRTPLLEAYDTVKLCAVLADPRGHVDGQWAAQRLAAEWRRLLPDGGTVDDERLTEHARRYLLAMQDRPALAWPLGSKLADARTRLKRLGVRDMAYRRLLLWAKSEPPVRASDVFGQASLEFLDSRGNVQVSGVYTANGWQRIREALRASSPWPQDAVVEGWVLDDSSVPRDDRALRDEVRGRYFDDFAERWMRFLAELRIKTPGDVDTARRELTAFKAEGFYRTLFTQFQLNAIHDDLDGAAGDGGAWLSRIPWIGKSDADAAAAAATTGPSPVERALRPILVFAGMADDARAAGGGAGQAPLDKYLAILDGLKADLGESPSPKQSLDDFQSHLTQAKTGVMELLDGVPDPARRALAQLLLPPIMGGVSAGTSEGQRSLSDDWKSMVWTAWSEKLEGHYPFRSAPSAPPANFADFAKFFRPGDGILWGFVNGRLATMVEQTGDGQYMPKQGADALAPDALACLTVAQEISDAFFHVGEEPGLKLSLQADWNEPDVTDTKFVVGAKETPLPKAQWSNVLRWFGEDVRVEWKQSGRPTQELGRHSFSLLDLFTNLGGLKGGGGARPLYTADCPPLTLKVRPEGRDALRPDFFTRLHCPQDLRILKP